MPCIQGEICGVYLGVRRQAFVLHGVNFVVF